MKKNIISLFIISILILAFIGCGKDGEPISYKEEALKHRSVAVLKGVIVDGYIVGASIRVEGVNSNGLTSGENGEYSIDISSNSEIIKIQASGGIDKATGEPFEGILRTAALPTSDVVYTTPLTTIVSFLADGGDSLDVAQKKVNSNLGFSDDLVLSKTDPFGDGLKKSVKIRLFKTTQQVQKVSEILKDSLDSDDISYNDIAKVLAKTISDNQGNRNSVDILNSDAFIKGVLSKVTGNQERASSKLSAVKVALQQMVHTIEGITSIEHSKNIHLISSIYEKQAKKINAATNIGDKSLEGLKLTMKNLTITLKDMSKVDSFRKSRGETSNLSLVNLLIDKVSDAKGVIDIEKIQKIIKVDTPNNGSNPIVSNSSPSLNTDPAPHPCSTYNKLTPPKDGQCNSSETGIPSFED